MSERVLVTGGAGYIGSHTLVDLLQSGYEVAVLDSLVNGHEDAIARVQKMSNRKIEFAVGDIRSRKDLDALFERFRPSKVVHFAGLKSANASMKIPLHYYDVNVTGTRTLLEAMDAHACQSIVFSSSATVYGEPEYLPIDEQHPVRPINAYGRSKLIAEQMIADWCAVEQSRSAYALRYFNPVGAHGSGSLGEDPRGVPDNLIPYVAQVAAGRLPTLHVFGTDYETRDGTGERDYIHVVDLARAHVAALQALPPQGGFEAINIGTGRGLTVLEIVKAFERAAGQSIKVVFNERRAGDVARSIADPFFAKQRLNWSAALDVDDMCHSAWTWQTRNPNGYDTKIGQLWKIDV